MSAADKASRLTITTRTAGTEHFDQVLALSARIINDGWETLADIYKDLQKIYIEDSDVGKLDAYLLPCRVCFHRSGTDRAGVYYQIRFASGTLENPSGTLTQKVDGWVLTVSVGVAEQKSSEMTNDQSKFINDHFDVPGDYTLTRLFADLTDAKWNQMETTMSTFGTNKTTGKPITWDEWKNANPKLKPKLTSFLECWVDDMSTKGYTTLGVKISSPTYEQQNPLDPTFPPTAMLHQAFEYKNDQTPQEIARDFNCIMYCEQIMKNPLPSATLIPDGGNWCYPASGSNPAVYGTFAISRHIFFERRNGFLEHIRPFCRLSEITLEDVIVRSWGGAHHSFQVGYNADHRSAEDNYFLAEMDEPNHQYIWNRSHTKQNGMTVDNKTYYYCSQDSEQQVSVSWQPGANTINLSGKTTYKYQTLLWKNSDKTDLLASLKESYTAKWSVPINITTDDDGRLDLHLGKKPEDVEVSVAQDYSQVNGNWKRQNSIEGYMREIQGPLQSTLGDVQKNLAQIFKTAGQWVYPGNGILYFRNPMFNNDSDVLAEVEYKPAPVAGGAVKGEQSAQSATGRERVKVPAPKGPDVLVKYPLTQPNPKSFTAILDTA